MEPVSYTHLDVYKRQVRGFVTHAPDTVHIGTPREVFDNLRLDYEDTEFRARDETVRVIRYQSDNAVYDLSLIHI